MRGAIVLAAPLLAMSLTACAQVKDTLGIEPGVPQGEDTCGLAKVNRYKGVPASAEVLAEIAAFVGEKNVRTIRPGDAVTMDFRPDRLNVELGAGGRIERLRCG